METVAVKVICNVEYNAELFWACFGAIASLKDFERSSVFSLAAADVWY